MSFHIDLDTESLLVGILLGMILHAIIIFTVALNVDKGFTDKQMIQLQYLCKEVKNEMGN